MVLDLSNEKYLKTLDNKHQVTPLMTQQKFANRFRARKGGRVGGGFLSKTDGFPLKHQKASSGLEMISVIDDIVI